MSKFSTEKALKCRAIFIGGDESSLRNQAVRELLLACNSDQDDFDREEIEADAKPFEEWLASCGTTPFLAERRILVVRRALRVNPKDFSGIERLSNLPETSLLIIVADDESAGDLDKQRRLTTIHKAWETVIAKQNGFVHLCIIDPRAARETLISIAKDAGYSFSPKACDTLLQIVGGNFSKASSELEKIMLFAGDNKELRENLVTQVAFASPDWTIWQLVNGVFERNPGLAIDSLNGLLQKSKDVGQIANGQVLPQLARNLRLLYQARACIDMGERPASPSDNMKALLPDKHLGLEKPFVLNKIVQQAGTLQLRQIAKCLDLTAEADARLKGEDGTSDPKEVLEMLLLQLIKTLSQKRAPAF